MAKERKSFILHKDSLTVLDELSDEEAGRLFKAIKAFQNSEEVELDGLTRIALHPFKAQFERDIESYSNVVNRNKVNGAKGGRPKKDENPKKPTKTQINPVGYSKTESNPTKPRKADSDSDSDSDSESESDSDSDKENITALIENEFDRFWLSGITKQAKTKALTAFKKQYKEAQKKTKGISEQVFTDYLIGDIKKRIAANVFGFDRMHPTTYLNQQRWNDDIVSGQPEKEEKDHWSAKM